MLDFNSELNDLGLNFVEDLLFEEEVSVGIEETYLISEMLYEFPIEDKIIQLPFYFTNNNELLNLLNQSSELIDASSDLYVLPFCKPVRNVRFMEKFRFNRVVPITRLGVETDLVIDESYESYYIFLLKILI